MSTKQWFIECPIVGHRVLAINAETPEEALAIVQADGFAIPEDVNEDERDDNIPVWGEMSLIGTQFKKATVATDKRKEAMASIFGAEG